MRITDENIVNMIKELSPASEVKLLRSWQGRTLDWKKIATFTINGDFVWIKLPALVEAHRMDGNPGVMARLCKLIEPIVGKVGHGAYDEHRLLEGIKRRQSRKAHWTEFAMKSAGSSEKEIYEALKYA